MEHRRIAIYLGSRKPTAKVQLNHLYTHKVDMIIFKTGDSKTEVARQLLMKAFETTDVEELRERIIYAANIIENSLAAKRKVGEVCKKALKMAIDSGYLL